MSPAETRRLFVAIELAEEKKKKTLSRLSGRKEHHEVAGEAAASSTGAGRNMNGGYQFG